MPKIWHLMTIFSALLVAGVIASLSIGSSVAVVASMIAVAVVYGMGTEYRHRWQTTWAATQIRSGKQRAGSTDGTGIGGGGAG